MRTPMSDFAQLIVWSTGRLDLYRGNVVEEGGIVICRMATKEAAQFIAEAVAEIATLKVWRTDVWAPHIPALKEKLEPDAAIDAAIMFDNELRDEVTDRLAELSDEESARIRNAIEWGAK